MSTSIDSPMPSQPLFCCTSVPVDRKSNIPPDHPLHQLLNHLSVQQDESVNNSEDAPTSDRNNRSAAAAQSPDSIPGGGECAIIILSDPNSPASPSSPSASPKPAFDPSQVRTRMYWGKIAPSTQEWEWREKVDARNNVGGILREVEGSQEGRLRKEMTGYDCVEHGWKYTFVVLIGVSPQERLRALMGKEGAQEGCQPQ